jgi:hypothetical protein
LRRLRASKTAITRWPLSACVVDLVDPEGLDIPKEYARHN